MMRHDVLAEIKDNSEITVLIIGGGINGAGVLRDLALQGVDVLLVDKGDFCSGASAASSHMIHGGIRYLENGEFRLVREAVKERNRLLQNAPHCVHPLATTIPIFKWRTGLLNAPLKFLNLLNRPSERGAVVIKAGLAMYDAFTIGQNTVPRHNFLLREASLRELPDLNPNIKCTATYYDAAMPSPERLCLEVLRDGVAAAQSHGSRVRALNYVAAVAGSADSITLQDQLTNTTYTVKPQIVVNATGAWIDLTNRAIKGKTRMMGGTKGSHLVLDNPQLHAAIQGREIFFENKDGRIVLIYPLKNRILVGTSDIAIDSPDDARCTEEEVDYFLGMIRLVFPKIEVNREQIVFRYAGVRPLPASDANSTGQISRDHKIKTIVPSGNQTYPILNLIGGKWTTFRAFSEKVTDQVLARLQVKRKIRTTAMPIGGGHGYPQTTEAVQQWIAVWHKVTKIDPKWLARWLERYGSNAMEIAQFSADSATPDSPLTHHPTYSHHEIAYLIENEWVVHLDDLLLRRSLMGMLGEVSAELIEEIATLNSAWNPTHEIEHTINIFADKHGVNF